MSKSQGVLREKLIEILNRHYKDEATLDQALEAIISAMLDILPQKASPLSASRSLSKRNVGWNEYRSALLLSLEVGSR